MEKHITVMKTLAEKTGFSDYRVRYIYDQFLKKNPNLSKHFFTTNDGVKKVICNIPETMQKLIYFAEEKGPGRKLKKKRVEITESQKPSEPKSSSDLVNQLKTTINGLKGLGYDVRCKVRPPEVEL